MDFACQEIDVEQVLSCTFGLSKSGCAVMKQLFAAPHPMTSDALASATGYDLATVQRALKHLSERGVLVRTQHNRPQGGYEYVYEPVKSDAFMGLVDDTFSSWLAQARSEVQSWSTKRGEIN